MSNISSTAIASSSLFHIETETSFETSPRYKGIGLISESFALNL